MAVAKQGLARAATRSINRAEVVDANFVRFCETWEREPLRRPRLEAPVRPGDELVVDDFLELLESQMLSRHLDFEARAMRLRGEGFYTIGSSGHEGNAVLGRLLRHTDPAYLHYRSGAFMMERARKVDGIDPVQDTALSLAASADDPISGGRHKVWGSVPLWVAPQTSTIASHLPKAMGAAVAIAQAKRVGQDLPVPRDSIISCSFGDASSNHATAQAAFNAAAWTDFQKLPCPILFVCEDNGLGISVRSPEGWVEANFRQRPGLQYFQSDGIDLVDTHEVAEEAIEHCRITRRPTFLHMKLVRLLGHAGTDAETEYRGIDDVERTEAADPLLVSARTCLESGILTAEELLARYEVCRAQVKATSALASKTPKLTERDAVLAPLAPFSPEAVNAEAQRPADPDARAVAFGGSLPENLPPRHLAIQINRALHDLMAKYPEMNLFGEDVAQKGGVYTITSGLYRAFRGRVFNTLLDETTILGMAQGQASMGLLPFPEIQYLAYFHNACDQLRGEACSLQFFSNDQFRNGMVVRIAGLGYQKGFGGHFHNDNSFTALRDIPGLIIACPSRGDDAAMMLRTAAALARVDGRVVAWLEPIALYMAKDLYADKDGQWLTEYPAPDQSIALGEGQVYPSDSSGDTADLLVVTYGNGVPMSLRSAKRLEDETGKRCRILDLRWLKPINRAFIAEHARQFERVLVVDEGRTTGGIAEEIITCLTEDLGQQARRVRMARVAGADCYVPLADAANLVLPQEDEILDAMRALLA
jgi:2-oxoisovalerate dehydrogenase E1 component